MHGPAVIGWLLTGLCALTGVACLLRAGAAGAVRRRAACSEALTGFGMAAMALPVLAPGHVPMTVFVVFFTVAAGWEIALLLERRHRLRHAAHHLHHAVGALAMACMALVALTGAGTGTGSGHHSATAHTGGTTAAVAGLPLLTGLLPAYFVLCALHAGVRLMPAGPGAGRAGAAPAGTAHASADTAVRTPADTVWNAPGFASACRLAMGTGMSAMLLPW